MATGVIVHIDGDAAAAWLNARHNGAVDFENNWVSAPMALVMDAMIEHVSIEVVEMDE